MTSSTLQHKVIRLNDRDRQAAKYQLLVFETGQHGEPLHHIKWSFRTFRGLLSFLQKNFPDSDLLTPLRCG
jgi:hypothetical protein